jgi:hypothetical protein
MEGYGYETSRVGILDKMLFSMTLRNFAKPTSFDRSPRVGNGEQLENPGIPRVLSTDV